MNANTKIQFAKFLCLCFIQFSFCIGLSAQSNTTARMKKIDFSVDSLLRLMTLEEKIGQMNQYNGFWEVTGPAPAGGNAKIKYEHLKKGWVGAVLNVKGVKDVRSLQEIVVRESRLGIPLLFGFDVIHGQKTLAPIPLAESASWDTTAIKQSAANAAKEAASLGLNWAFAPMVDVTRDARWGRVMEGAGEDPFLGSVIAKMRVQGFQGDDLSAPYAIAACAKHFAAYGFVESGKEYNLVDIGTSTLYNMILPPFKAAADAGVASFMNSFNTLNGIPATANTFLQRDILKGAWGYKGFVVSDWGSIGEMVAHGYSKDLTEAAEQAVKAGSDMDMESSAYIGHLKQLVESGKVNEALINDAAGRILRIKYQLGLFDDPYKYCREGDEKNVIGSKQIIADAFDMAKKSIVLLKNDENKNTKKALLPIATSQKIAVIGSLAADKDSPLGSWRLGADDNTAVSVLEGLKNYKINFTYEKGVDVINKKASFTEEVNLNTKDSSGFAAAIWLAKASSVVVMVLGENGYMTGEGRSRTDLGLPGLQQQLLEAVYKVNKNIILVVQSGRPLVLTWADANIPAIIEAWQLGSEAGNAVAAVLSGQYNPSGKLTMSFPRSVGQLPLYYNYLSTGRGATQPNVFWSHYSDESNLPLYPFGFGLSYTKFNFSPMEILKSGQSITVKSTIKNIGKVDGEEVVQLYIRDKFSSVARPVKELKGFKKLMIKAGSSAQVSFTLTKQELGFFDNNGKFIFEGGDFDIFIGTNSRDVQQETVNLPDSFGN